MVVDDILDEQATELTRIRSDGLEDDNYEHSESLSKPLSFCH